MTLKDKKIILWIAWSIFTIGTVAYFLTVMLTQNQSQIMLPGETTHGHHQIEMDCSACHTPMMGVKTDACMDCHGAELKAANDSHPAKKFTDPRNADRIAVLDATDCMACHKEHDPDVTHAMGVTMPEDYCFRCHEDVGQERPSHIGLGFQTCQTAGCHNYHDNKALYEDFLAAHVGEANYLDKKIRDLLPSQKSNKSALVETDANAPLEHMANQTILKDWLETAHAKASVNCMDCHSSKKTSTEWVAQPGIESCARCHDNAAKSFKEGKHGMRLAHGLSPMTPAMAKLPMKKANLHKELDCASCHTSHRFDLKTAAVESCLQCHDDEHSRNYVGSPHHNLWQNELQGTLPAGSGVSCASCHMPTLEHPETGNLWVQHNQNDNLRPNEKMIRPVCMDCHGLGFSIDSLADPLLIKNNFNGLPSKHIESLDWVKKRDEAYKAKEKNKS